MRTGRLLILFTICVLIVYFTPRLFLQEPPWLVLEPVQFRLELCIGILDCHLEFVHVLLVLVDNAVSTSNVLVALDRDRALLHDWVVVNSLLGAVIILAALCSLIAAVCQNNLVVVLGVVIHFRLLNRLVSPEARELEAGDTFLVVDVEAIVQLGDVAVGVVDVELGPEPVACLEVGGQVVVVVHHIRRSWVILRVAFVRRERRVPFVLFHTASLYGLQDAREKTGIVDVTRVHGVVGELDGDIGARVGEGFDVGEERKCVDDLDVTFRIRRILDAGSVGQVRRRDIEALLDPPLDPGGRSPVWFWRRLALLGPVAGGIRRLEKDVGFRLAHRGRDILRPPEERDRGVVYLGLPEGRQGSEEESIFGVDGLRLRCSLVCYLNVSLRTGTDFTE